MSARDARPLQRFERLAELLVGFGANLQPGQILGVTAYLGMEDIARAIAREAYKRGAKYVDVLWWDQLVKRAAAGARGRGARSSSCRRGSAQRMQLALGRARGPHRADRRRAASVFDGARPGPHGPRPAAVHLRGAAGSSTSGRRTGPPGRARTSAGPAASIPSSSRRRRSTSSGTRSSTSSGWTRTTRSPPGTSGWRRSSRAPTGSPSGGSTRST